MQQPYRNSRSVKAGKARPGLDMVTVRKQASQFPSVGMTLPSYNYDPRDRNRHRPGQPVVVKRPWWRRITRKRVAVTFAVIALLLGIWVGGKFIYNAHKLFGGNILSVLSSTKLKGEDEGRVNILLAGNSRDDPGHGGAELTDSIMILSIDTKNNRAFMLSVPRDLWVKVPGNGHEKINGAYVDGEEENFSASGYPDGGMGLLEQVVEHNFGIKLNYYALIDYQALKQSVDAVGGVDITVKSNDPRGLYDPSIDYAAHPHKALVKLSNGTHHLNGQQALGFARARGDAYGSYGFAAADFDRTAHQRQLLVALKNKAVSAGTLTNPAKLSSLSDAAGNNVKTDFKLDEVHRLYDIMKGIDSNNIKSLSLNSADGKNLLASYSAPDGSSALSPAAGLDDFSDIKAYMRKQTSNNPIVQEEANVVILNASGSSGLASRQKTVLTTKQLHVTDVGNAKQDQSSTTIIDASGGRKPATRLLLLNTYGNANKTNITTANPYSRVYDEADFIVLLGTDQVSRNKASGQ
jgi:LCP family protein required for cell wall assembly